MNLGVNIHLGEWSNARLRIEFTKPQIWTCAHNPTFIIAIKIAAAQNSEKSKDFTQENDWMNGWVLNSQNSKSHIWTCECGPNVITMPNLQKCQKIPLGRMLYYMIEYLIHKTTNHKSRHDTDNLKSPIIHDNICSFIHKKCHPKSYHSDIKSLMTLNIKFSVVEVQDSRKIYRSLWRNLEYMPQISKEILKDVNI